MKKRLEINHKVLDAALPPMSKEYENRANQVLYQVTTQQEEPVVKKKISAGLMLALVLILTLTIAAVAATMLWESYVPQVKQMEHERGAYAGWPVEDKMELMHVLVDNGNIAESEDTRRLFDETTPEEEAHAIADKLLMELTQVEDASEINMELITYSIMGFYESWTPEQRVWWQQITNMYRSPEMIESDTFVVPTAEDISEEEAIEIARSAIVDAYGLSDDYFDHNSHAVADLYVTEQRPDYRRWSIILQVYREGSDSYVEKSFSAVVDNTGKIIADPDIDMPNVVDAASSYREIMSLHDRMDKDPVFMTVRAFDEEYNPIYSFGTISLEAKAYFSEHIRPLILKAVEENPDSELNDYLPVAQTQYVYGLPGADCITEEAAQALAREAILAQRPIAAEMLERYTVQTVFFDITNPDKPLWKFYFEPDALNLYEMEGKGLLKASDWEAGYKVELDARDGTIARLWVQKKLRDPDDAMMYMY